MSWGIDFTIAIKDVAAKCDEEKARLTPMLSAIPTELADMQSALDRVKFYASVIDIDAYRDAFGRSDYQPNALRVQACGSHSMVMVGQAMAIGGASCKFDVSPTELKPTA